MAGKKSTKKTIKNPDTTLCDNFEALQKETSSAEPTESTETNEKDAEQENSEDTTKDTEVKEEDTNKNNNKKRCINCKYFKSDNKSCTFKQNSAVIREVLEFKDLEDSYNYTCKEQLSYCFSCSCFCKENDDFYCDYGKFGLGLAQREEIKWKEIKNPTESTCESFGNKNPLGLTIFSSSYCQNCRYFFSEKGCMKNSDAKLTKIKWKKIENPKFEKCKLFERARTNVQTTLNTTNEINCYKCKFFNTEFGCMNKKGKPKASYKEIEKPDLQVCKAYQPSWLRKHDYTDSCLTCKFFVKDKGCINPEKKSVKDIKRLKK